VELTGTEHLPNSNISRRTPEAQGQIPWKAPGGTLGELLEAAESRVHQLRLSAGRLAEAAGKAARQPGFAQALKGPQVRVIAEVKRSSPSKGAINPELQVSDQCRAYEDGGAAAVSVLTEPTRFSGRLADLSEARAACALPLLRKDFIIDRLQLLEAKAAGASGVLLIARGLRPTLLKALFDEAVSLGLEPLVEVRDEAELLRALDVGANIIGVNNRDLETLAVDDTAGRLIPLIPRSCVAVAESGYRSADDIMRIARRGADAVLIGSELSRSADPARTLARLTSIPSTGDARQD